jgi:hypothetical protein
MQSSLSVTALPRGGEMQAALRYIGSGRELDSSEFEQKSQQHKIKITINLSTKAPFNRAKRSF